MNASMSQNTQSKEVNLTLPTFTLNTARFYPLAKEGGSKKGLFQNINIQYSAKAENRVILADSLLLIGLDNYLGSEHPFYSSMPKYISDNLIPRMIISDIAEEYAYYVIPKANFYTFLEKIIFYGKVLYLSLIHI